MKTVNIHKHTKNWILTSWSSTVLRPDVFHKIINYMSIKPTVILEFFSSNGLLSKTHFRICAQTTYQLHLAIILGPQIDCAAIPASLSTMTECVRYLPPTNQQTRFSSFSPAQQPPDRVCAFDGTDTRSTWYLPFRWQAARRILSHRRWCCWQACSARRAVSSSSGNVVPIQSERV